MQSLQSPQSQDQPVVDVFNRYSHDRVRARAPEDFDPTGNSTSSRPTGP